MKNNEMGGVRSTYEGEERCAQGFGGEKGNRQLGRPRRKSKDNIKMDLQELDWGHGLDWPGLE